ncbi:Flagellar hook-associated protein FlgK [uncultured delta proteobacterium]|uniref:Flagellar hook-associated protein 1 n=1 Tax=uncultured delta proteobacterium TaxID=34034 RepID=A0A212JLS8_9DELT|nr:Flagellar hook-associated protein FlgK [uncultured delta proteobacterium]
MASNINSILGIGAGALYAHQNSIQTTGNNIANVDTEGYSRQGVRYETNPSLNASPGQIGQGVRATEVYRMFNRFVEKAYINKSSDASRWAEQYNMLSNVDALVYESDTIPGVANTLNKFFKGWQTLSNNGTLISSREALLSDAQTLSTFVSEQSATLKYMQQQMDGLIQTDVDRANKLMQEIAELNGQINQFSIPGQNNPNALLDQRDLKVRQLSEIIDIDIIDRGEGHYTVNTKSGLTLVDETNHFNLEFHGPKVNDYRSKVPPSTYTGDVHFEGSDHYEYTVQVVKGGSVGTAGAAGTATFRVSLDSGNTWQCKDGAYRTEAQVNAMSPADQAEKGFMEYEANDSSKPAYVNGIKIWFDSGQGNLVAKGDPSTDPTVPVYADSDKFEIVPKSGLYWKRPTGEERVNITPMRMADGSENPRRTTGGTLGAYFEFRDHLLGGYLDKLDTFANTLSWEVNRIHSQGFGLGARNSILGDYQVQNGTVPLSSPYSGLTFGDKMQAGTLSVAMFDVDGKPLLDTANKHIVLEVTFDPTTGSLQDLTDAINAEAATKLAGSGVSFSASVTDGKLDLNSLNGGFGFMDDTTGVLAGLGVNTFFKGDSAADFSVNADIVRNLNLINAAAINGGGEGNSGDTLTALEISQLATKKVSITENGTGKKTEQTMLSYYSSYVTKVGADTQTAKYNATMYGTMAGDLRNQQDSNAGVSLDEEMTNLVKFQNSYKAAAKLITTADEMLQTVIGLKQ